VCHWIGRSTIAVGNPSSGMSGMNNGRINVAGRKPRELPAPRRTADSQKRPRNLRAVHARRKCTSEEGRGREFTRGAAIHRRPIAQSNRTIPMSAMPSSLDATRAGSRAWTFARRVTEHLLKGAFILRDGITSSPFPLKVED